MREILFNAYTHRSHCHLADRDRAPRRGLSGVHCSGDARRVGRSDRGATQRITELQATGTGYRRTSRGHLFHRPVYLLDTCGRPACGTSCLPHEQLFDCIEVFYNQRRSHSSMPEDSRRRNQVDSPNNSKADTTWQDIALLTVVIFYLAQFGLDLFVWKTLFGNLGGDYGAYWSAATIANEYGYAEIYDLDTSRDYQRTIAPAGFPFSVRPYPYLPIFLVPFQALTLATPAFGYWIWTFINVALPVFYLRYFVQRTTLQSMDRRVLVMLCLSLPFFLNLFFGQVNLYLILCIGEHLRAAVAGKPFRAGMWLSGLLIKPQFLGPIGIVFLIQRYVKVLAGLTVASLLVLGISFIMVGVDGFKALLDLWLRYPGELSAVDPFIMMNWRMVGINLAPYFGHSVGWFIAITGMTITTAMAVYLWRRRIDLESSVYPIALMGTIAATMSVTWHSHIFSGIIVLAPLAYLASKGGQLPEEHIIQLGIYPATRSSCSSHSGWDGKGP